MLDKFFKNDTLEKKKKVEKNNKATWDWAREFIKFDNTGKLNSDLDKAQFLKGVKNFVKILTGKNISVKYEVGDASFTDGKSITLSADIKETNLDSTVGLALHESSHIVLSNFPLIKNIVTSPEKVLSKETKDFNMIVKDLFNWVEDRRIDDWVYTTAPGYQPYYTALYDRYFWSEQTSEIVKEYKKTVNFKKPTTENYMFYIINLLNEEVKGDELPDLEKIKDLINLREIKRLTSSSECLTVADDITKIIAKNVDKNDMQQTQQQMKDSSKSKEMSSEELEKAIQDAIKKGNFKVASKNLLDKQRNFVNGKMSKEEMASDKSKKITVLANCDTSIEDVQQDSPSSPSSSPSKNDTNYSNPWHNKSNGTGHWEVVTINKVDYEAIESQAFDIFRKNELYGKEVEEGLRLGRLLSNKLKQRIEERETKNPRLKGGKIDKRMLHTAGYDNANIFYNVQVDKYEQLNIHISLDLSGSMGGSKWKNALISTVSILSATSKIKNIRTQLSFRYTSNLSDTQGEKAFVIQFYDSAIDKESKIKWLKHVTPAGGTPEGLCYEALMKKIIKPIMNKRTIFINYSDGQPYMWTMSTDQGVAITKQSVKKMKSSGVEVLSFFITDGNHHGYEADSMFKDMYGKDARSVHVTNLLSLAKELNNKFLSKSI